jgi:hypothetical protein
MGCIGRGFTGLIIAILLAIAFPICTYAEKSHDLDAFNKRAEALSATWPRRSRSQRGRLLSRNSVPTITMPEIMNYQVAYAGG